MKTYLVPLTLLLSLAVIPASAQWFDIQKKGLPRNPDGSVNLNAPVPKLASGKPDLTGIWIGDQWAPKGRRPNPPSRQLQTSKMLPGAKKIYEERMATNMKDDPKVRCMPNGVPHAATEPYPWEVIVTPEKTVILYEMYSTRRQIFTDGRELPKNPQEFTPTWMGYSVGRWEGDDFVVETTGFNSRVWPIDMGAHPSTDALRVTERMKRVSFGHMDMTVTIDDPKSYEAPWNMNLRFTLLPESDLLEFECEVNTSADHMVGK